MRSDLHNVANVANVANSNAALGSQAQTAGCAIRVSELEVICSRLSDVLNYLSHQGGRLYDIDARLAGPRPANPTGKGDLPVQPSLIGRMSSSLDEIMVQLHDNDETVSRLNSTI